MKVIKQLSSYLLAGLAVGSMVACTRLDNTPKPQVLSATVSTFAGNPVKGNQDGTGKAASFYNPTDVTADAAGNLYVVDGDNYLIRKITPAGVVSVFAGSGDAGSANGTGTAASFNLPNGIAIDGGGNLYVADAANKLIRKITPGGVVTTFAGSGKNEEDDGAANVASFMVPNSIAIDPSGNLFVLDFRNIRKITPDGTVSTFKSYNSLGFGPGRIAIDAAGNLYVTDGDNHLVRKITQAGVVSTIAGNGSKGSVDGPAATASFDIPLAIAIDAQGNLFVSDDNDFRIRMISTTGMVTTIAGKGISGDTDGPGMDATFSGVTGMIISGNTLYLADTPNNSIRAITFQ